MRSVQWPANYRFAVPTRNEIAASGRTATGVRRCSARQRIPQRKPARWRASFNTCSATSRSFRVDATLITRIGDSQPGAAARARRVRDSMAESTYLHRWRTDAIPARMKGLSKFTRERRPGRASAAVPTFRYVFPTRLTSSIGPESRLRWCRGGDLCALRAEMSASA